MNDERKYVFGACDYCFKNTDHEIFRNGLKMCTYCYNWNVLTVTKECLD